MAEKRKFIECKVPLINSSMRILGSLEESKGKTIKLDLTRKLKGKGLIVTFEIVRKENELIALPKKMELAKSYIQKIMRKRIDYVEDSFKTQTKDINVTIKPFLITRKKVSRAIRKNLRNTAREFLIEYVKQKDYLEICDEIYKGTLQKELYPKLKKIYPLSFCDLRVFETREIQKISLENIKQEEKTQELYQDEEYEEEIINDELEEEEE